MKKTLRRLTAMCLSLVMLLSLVACGGDPAETPDDGTTATTAPSAGNDTTTTTTTTPGGDDTSAEDEAALTEVREELIKKSETEGLGEITALELYENGVRIAGDELVQARDNKKIYWAGDIKRVINYPDGYMIEIPQDWKPDYSLSMRSRYDSDEVSLIVTREDYAVQYHHGVRNYLNALYLYLKDEDFQKNNGISVVDEGQMMEVGDWTAEIYRVKLDDCDEGVKAYYTYVDLYNDLNNTVHMMFKCVDDREFTDVIESFQRVAQKGAQMDSWTYEQSNNPNWNDTTTTYYENLMKQDHVDWGLFSYKLQTTGWKINIPLMEKKMDFKFPIISEYIHYGGMETMSSELKVGEFPVAFSEDMEKDGRMMQITYQYTVNNNTDMTFYNPILDIYRGTDESKEVLTQFAEGAAQFDKPFFFRLNNEMNTDWTSYCAMANLLDPDIFIDTWVTLYDIFTETGANEYAMWVFNGFDKSYPPYNWCDYRCYMPDAQYVDLIGLTGYNMGTGSTGGTWKSFSELYDGICESAGYDKYFGDWPWIISEFGCVSRDDVEGQGVDAKAAWITEMFDCFESGRYPNIKVAVWFNSNDYVDGVVTNKLVIDKDPEVLEAFGEGLKRTVPDA